MKNSLENTIVKYNLFMAWEFEEEEAWLNEMASQGLNLIKVNGIKYIFERGIPGEYQYKLEMLNELPGTAESRDYLYFMEEAGIETIGSYLKWVYYRKKNDGTPFEVFSDLDSKLNHLKRINRLLKGLFTILCVIIGVDLLLMVLHEIIAPAVIPLAILAFALKRGINKINIKEEKLSCEKGVYQ